MRTPVVRLTLKDVMSSFKIDIRSFYKNKVYVHHHLHIQPSEIDNLCYYEYQWLITDLIQMLKEQNGDKSDSGQNAQMDNMQSNMNKYAKGMNNSVPKMPSFGGFKMPKL